MDDAVILGVRIVAFLALAALAIMLLVANRTAATNRTLAALLVLVGSQQLLGGLLLLGHFGRADAAMFRVIVALSLAVLVALAWFLLLVLAPHDRRARAARFASLALGLAAAIWMAAEPCAVECGPDDAVRSGPLLLLHNSLGLATGVVALVLGLALDRLPAASGARARPLRLVALGLALSPMLSGALAMAAWTEVGQVTDATDTAWSQAILPARALALLPATAAVVALVRREVRTAPKRLRPALMAAAASGVALTGFWLGQVPASEPGPFAASSFLTVAFPAFVTYALVRHRLFGVEIAARWTVVHSPLGAAILAPFFVMSQVLEQYFSGKGYLLGGVLAGLALFAIHPLQRLGERIALDLVPSAGPTQHLGKEERVRIYRDQLQLVWADGVMGRKERLLLDHLRARLGISERVAARLEHEAAAMAPPQAIASLASRATRAP